MNNIPVKLSQEEAQDNFLDAWITLLSEDASFERDIIEKWGFFERFYKPDQELRKRLQDYEDWYTRKTGENPGQLMEELAFLAFRCLSGHDSIKSGQSETAQHDLIITGSSLLWFFFMKLLHLPQEGRKILIEAKNTDEKVDDPHFSRLCFLLQTKFQQQCHLGIFFTRSGATSFPEPETASQRSLRDARATQILFHAMTNKYIIVFDHSHIIRLKQDGALPRIIEALIRDIEDRLGSAIGFDEQWKESDALPAHLEKYNLQDKGA